MKRREPITPDMTPIVDVVFLLLIFFLVSTSFKKDELALLLNLPSTHAEIKAIKKEEINIELSEKDLALKGKVISFKKLDSILVNVNDKERSINVRIDKEVRYERISKLFDLLKTHDLNNLALISDSLE